MHLVNEALEQVKKKKKPCRSLQTALPELQRRLSRTDYYVVPFPQRRRQ